MMATETELGRSAYDGNKLRVTVNSHSVLGVTAYRRFQDHGRACVRRDYIEPASKFLSTAAHAIQSLTMSHARFVETTPIVAQLQDDHPALNLQHRFSRFASGVSRDVVDGFFENQKDLAAHLRA